jgi:hypothetical protein
MPTPPRGVTAVLALLAACSKPVSVEESQQQAFAAACVAVTAKHPTTIGEFVKVVGSQPSDCTLGPGDSPDHDAVCGCTWTFFTSGGAKEIVAIALHEDDRNAKHEGVQVVARDGGVSEMSPDKAEAAWRSGAYSLASVDGRVPVRSPDGEIGTVAPNEAQAELVGGGHLVSPRSLAGAARDREYATWTVQRRIGTCTTSMSRVLSAQLGDTVLTM